MTNEERQALIERCNQLYHYNPESGQLIRKINSSNAKAGAVVGCLNKADGYLKVTVFNKRYQAHRIIYLMMTGTLPDEIDHINGVRNDNRWCNLRVACRIDNARNTTKPKTNTSGHKGVTWRKRDRKWCAQIQVNGKGVFLGNFEDIEIAALVASEARDKYFGQFNRKAEGG